MEYKKNKKVKSAGRLGLTLLYVKGDADLECMETYSNKIDLTIQNKQESLRNSLIRSL